MLFVHALLSRHFPIHPARFIYLQYFYDHSWQDLSPCTSSYRHSFITRLLAGLGGGRGSLPIVTVFYFFLVTQNIYFKHMLVCVCLKLILKVPYIALFTRIKKRGLMTRRIIHKNNQLWDFRCVQTGKSQPQDQPNVPTRGLFK